MSLKNFVILIIKIILDVSSRILLFSAWMYTSSDGNFSIWKTLTLHYPGCEMVLVIREGVIMTPPEINQNEATESCEGSN